MLRWKTKTIAPPDYYVRLRDRQISFFIRPGTKANGQSDMHS